MPENIEIRPVSKQVISIVPAAHEAPQVVSLYQTEEKIYPRSVSGWFRNWRWSMVWLTQLFFYGVPWFMLHNRQALLFDIGSRRFYIFNLVLYPQDLIYLTGLLVISALSLFLFTAVAGRLWCGYTCPQTVYTEMFMWIERKIEGDRVARIRLDKSTLSFAKLTRKSAKHAAWLAIGLWTGFTFVGYFTPIRDLANEVSRWSLGSWEIFWIFFYGLATYGNAGWMREQVCKYMCPYARFQSAMFDKDTLIVAYDSDRGEGRGPRARSETTAQYQAKGLGDCIGCDLCVQVCPTGIDIRDGLQYECISCSACIDVCNTVMKKMNYPKGLISYSTQNAAAKKLSSSDMLRSALRPRVLIYACFLFTVIFALAWSLVARIPFKVDVVRDRGAMARIVEQGMIENVYRLQIMNATENISHYHIGVDGIDNIKIVSDATGTVDAAGSRWVPVRVQIPPTASTVGSHTIIFTISMQSDPSIVVKEKSAFIVPR